MTRPALRFTDRLARDAPVVTDGGLATELARHGVALDDALWSGRAVLDAPRALARVHADYAAAGAELLSSSSYQLHHAPLRARGLDDEAQRACFIATIDAARAAADDAPHPIWVGASLGPYGATLPGAREYTGDYDVTPAALEAFQRARLDALLAAAPDVVVAETLPRLDEARAVLVALADRAPVMLSFTLGDDGALPSGEPLVDVGALATSTPAVIAVGVNCVAPARVAPALRALADATDRPLIARPNRGERYVPGRGFEGRSDVDPLVDAPAWVALGARVVGGCCRTTPDDIRVLVTRLHGA